MKSIAVITLFALTTVAAACAPTTPDHDDNPTGQARDKLVLGGARAGEPGPAGALFNGHPVITFVGTDRQVNVVRRLPDGSWADPLPVGEFTTGNRGAAVIAFVGVLHLVWFDQDKNFCWIQSNDAVSWLGKKCVGGVSGSNFTTVGEPALVIFNNRPHALFAQIPTSTGSDTAWNQHGRLRLFGLNEAMTDWLDHTSTSGQTLSTPSAATLNGELFIAWNHRDGQSFRTAKFVGGGFASAVFQARAHEGHLSTAVTWPETLLWIYRETGGPEANMIKFDRSSDGVNFEWVTNTDHTSAHRPFGVMVADGFVRFSHIGQDGIRGVNYTEVEDGAFPAP